jgi:hypothetical protein
MGSCESDSDAVRLGNKQSGGGNLSEDYSGCKQLQHHGEQFYYE